jgi:hypothetical protein
MAAPAAARAALAGAVERLTPRQTEVDAAAVAVARVAALQGAAVAPVVLAKAAPAAAMRAAPAAVVAAAVTAAAKGKAAVTATGTGTGTGTGTATSKLSPHEHPNGGELPRHFFFATRNAQHDHRAFRLRGRGPLDPLGRR